MTRKIVAFTGKRGHGKTTAAQVLEEKGYRHINFADPLRQVVHIVYGVSFEEMTDPVLKEKPLERWPFKSPRELLQVVGTDMFRKTRFADDLPLEETWTRAFKRACFNYSHVVCSDLRFPNEGDCVRHGHEDDQDDLFDEVHVIRIVNPLKQATDTASQHASETEIDKIVVDATVINDSTIFELQDRALQAAGY